MFQRTTRDFVRDFSTTTKCISEGVEPVLSIVGHTGWIETSYISVTYGAGGSSNHADTVALCQLIKARYGIEAVAHIAGVNFTRASVQQYLAKLQDAKVENVLALRGDLPADGVIKGDFQYANELVSEIKQDGDFNVIGACYPDVHPEAADSVDDIRHLKCKVDAGVSQLITQLFFENEHYYQFLERFELANVNVQSKPASCQWSMNDKFQKWPP